MVQEYGEDCPAPNTNRVYISYVDSVRYLESTGGERGGRTPLYHAIINGYLKHAADRGFGYAHLWVAPPEEGVEYIFHAPNHGQRKPMTPAVLRAWYEKMLDRAEELGIVSNVNSLQKEVAHLTSVRDFPTFDGDFFPDRFPDIIRKRRRRPTGCGAPPTSGRGGPPALARAQSLAPRGGGEGGGRVGVLGLPRRAPPGHLGAAVGQARAAVRARPDRLADALPRDVRRAPLAV